jgi:hypothetical protein
MNTTGTKTPSSPGPDLALQQGDGREREQRDRRQVHRGHVARPPANPGPDEPDGKPDETEAEHQGHEEAEQRQPAGMHDLLLRPTGHDYPYLAGRLTNPG